jgi:HD-like signal output (HDOD) protein
LVLAVSYSEEYDRLLAAAKHEGVSTHQAERQLFGGTHAEIGAYLLWLWGLPDEVCQAVAFHHRPADSSHSAFTAATAIHVADALEHELSSPAERVCLAAVDISHLTRLGLADRLPEWRQIGVQHARKEEQA